MLLDVNRKKVLGIRRNEKHTICEDLGLDLSLSQTCSERGEGQRGIRADEMDGWPPPAVEPPVTVIYSTSSAHCQAVSILSTVSGY